MGLADVKIGFVLASSSWAADTKIQQIQRKKFMTKVWSEWVSLRGKALHAPHVAAVLLPFFLY